MANKYDIKTANVVIGTATANTTFGIGAVPEGKTRFVTFVKAVNRFIGAGTTNNLYLISYTASQVASLASAITNKKLTQDFFATASVAPVMIPEKPDLESPLFTVAGGNHLAGRTSRGNVDVFVQYYDE